MLKLFQEYSYDEWKRQTVIKVYGMEKDVLKDKYAPTIPYADFNLAEDVHGGYVYAMKFVPSKDFTDKLFHIRKVKIIAVLTKEEFALI